MTTLTLQTMNNKTLATSQRPVSTRQQANKGSSPANGGLFYAF